MTPYQVTLCPGISIPCGKSWVYKTKERPSLNCFRIESIAAFSKTVSHYIVHNETELFEIEGGMVYPYSSV